PSSFTRINQALRTYAVMSADFDGTLMSDVTSTKPYRIAKRSVWDPYKQVKANQGAAGIVSVQATHPCGLSTKDNRTTKTVTPVKPIGWRRTKSSASRGQRYHFARGERSITHRFPLF
ncbi:hypothetical protein JKG47_20360, partial [Acidithiobacillus sp. MC6.1]|nr:hypothetical protein [Acidithiobacillus sp. MC6.1]